MRGRNWASRVLMVGLVLTLVLAIGYGQTTPPAQSPIVTSSPGKFIYSAKFVCGSIAGPLGLLNPKDEPPVKPGNYATAINIHNPGVVPVKFQKKVALTFPPTDGPESPGLVSKFIDAALNPDQALEIDCNDIAISFGLPIAPFIKGFVVIESPQLLDAVVVYTSELILDKIIVKLGFPPHFELAARFPLPTGRPIAFKVPDIGPRRLSSTAASSESSSCPCPSSGSIVDPIDEVMTVIEENLRAANMDEKDITTVRGNIQIQIEDIDVALGQTLDVEEVKPKLLTTTDPVMVIDPLRSVWGLNGQVKH